MFVVSFAASLCFTASSFAEKPYLLTPTPLRSDGVDIQYTGKRLVSYCPPGKKCDPRPTSGGQVPITPLQIFGVDIHQITFDSSVDALTELQVVDLVPDRSNFSQPSEETIINFSTDIMIFKDGPAQNAKIIMRENIIGSRFLDGLESIYWLGTSYIIGLHGEANKIIVQEYLGEKLVKIWQGNFSLKKGVTYTVNISHHYGKQLTSLYITEKNVNLSGKPVHAQIFTATLQSLGFRPIAGKTLRLFSIGAINSHTKFWNTTVSESAFSDLPQIEVIRAQR